MMNKLFAFSGALFLVCFLSVYSFNAFNPGEEYRFDAPYSFEVGGLVSIVTSYFFVFITSLLFFGYGAPIALAVEGVKYASLFSLSALPAFDLLFIVPQFLACYSAVRIGEGALEDFANRGSLYSRWRDAFKYFMISLVLLAVLLLLRRFF